MVSGLQPSGAETRQELWNPGGRAMARVPEPGAQLLGALSRINLKWDGGECPGQFWGNRRNPG